MNQLQAFQNKSFGDLEILEVEGKFLFPATDVAKKLGYQKPHDAITRHCKEMGTSFHGVIDSLGRIQNKKFINEGNLYRLITNSKLPQAEQFEEWVFDEVLPQIRRTGKYEEPKSPMEMLELQFKALKETSERVETVEKDVTYLKEEVKLEAGEYSYISRQVNRTVADTIKAFALANTKEVRSALFKDINTGINDIAGIKTRTQLRQKHFNIVIDFINQWTPSTVTLMKTRQITLELAESEEDRTAE